jgi:integrase
MTGRWAKKIRGRMHYFGPWADPDAALAKYLEQKDSLHAGRTPRADPAELTVKMLANEFLRHKKALVESGDISPRTRDEHKEATDLLVATFGKGRLVADLSPLDFATLRAKMAKRWGPTRLGNVIQRVRSVFKFASDSQLTDKVVRFGPAFKRPSAKVLLVHRAQQGRKLFAAADIRRMIDAADTQLRAAVLLGVNCGFGVADCGRLPLEALDLDGAWVDFPRPKSGKPRRAWLWPETVAALREAIARRPQPKNPDDAGLCLLTAQGYAWHKAENSGPMVFKMRSLLKRLGINARKGLGIYTLRHVFRTVADETKDQVCVDYVMGHTDPSMAGRYREHIGDDRIRAVCEHVRRWLFPQPVATPAGPASGPVA